MTEPAITTTLRGRALLNDPALNKGTAFTAEERIELGIGPRLPQRVETIDEQCRRIDRKYEVLHDDLERHIFLRSLQDTNEVLFYHYIVRNLVELMPIIYTPTVGEACREFSHIYRRPHGIFVSYDYRHTIDDQLAAVDHEVDVVVVTDGQRILGLGDQGLGGMGIPIGKLSLYTAVGGIDPTRALPVLLDVGTDNQELIGDPLYLGCRRSRVTGAEYDEFVELFVEALNRRFPGALLQWEDFASEHAAPLLERYRDRCLSFNDDIQGTAAVTLAAIVGGLRISGGALADQRILIVGAGSAGTGIADMLVGALGPDAGASAIHLIDRDGILHDGRDDLADYQQPYAQPRDRVAALAGVTDLAAVVDHVRPTVMIGVSGQPGLFTEAVVTTMARHCPRPIIMPLSNPTSRAEATPADLLRWTEGRALVATGSPFDPVVHHGATHVISQSNNVYVFPGLGLGALLANATRITDGMLVAAAEAVGDPEGAADGAGLLPPLDDVRATSRRIAVAVALAAAAEGVGDVIDRPEVERRLAERWWEPVYRPIVAG